MLLWVSGDPVADGEAICHAVEDGLVLIKDGHIEAVGPVDLMAPRVDGVLPPPSAAMILPGFVDTHIHFPQVDMVASHGDQLLDWLEAYTFPAEAKYSDPDHCDEAARFFLNECLRNGTTTALVFGSVHKQSVEALFARAHVLNMRLAAGKALMDQNVPDMVADSAETGDANSRTLIERWHGTGRLSYAVTPRFAPACSSDQMHRAAQILADYPDVLMQTHLSENPDEIAWVKDLFPDAEGYLDVYKRHGLLTDRSVFAHCIHVTDDECAALAAAGAGVAFCPTSNLFLGSGLFNLEKLQSHGIDIGLGTDIGAGTSFSQWASMHEAYKVSQLQGQTLGPWKSLYLATLGGARILKMDDKIGSLEAGKEADIIVLDTEATPLLARRLRQCKTVDEKLFVMQILGDDRLIAQSWVAGRCLYDKASGFTIS